VRQLQFVAIVYTLSTNANTKRQENKMSQESISWGELAELTHNTQVARFNWCSCEDNEGQDNPYSDCPKTGENK